MKPQEAIENINNILDSPYLCDESIDYQLTTDDIECLEMSKQALEKQIPKKPNLQGDGYADGELVYDYAECPVCGCDFEEESNCWGCKFCPDCGQALDWSDAE